MTVRFSDLSNPALVEAVVASDRAILNGIGSRSANRSGVYRKHAKRVLDIAVVLASAIVVLPVVFLLVLAAALDGASPFYTQKRVGQNGRIFKMLKIRSMVPHADAQLAVYLERCPEARHEWDTTQKLKKDPRITAVGRFIRKTSLDELPQLWNVLTGDMSIVGPRPMMPSQRGLYPGSAYYALRPGITGLWQVSDRNECSFAERSRFDSAYERKLSLGLDVSIILRTFKVVARGTGY